MTHEEFFIKVINKLSIGEGMELVPSKETKLEKDGEEYILYYTEEDMKDVDSFISKIEKEHDRQQRRVARFKGFALFAVVILEVIISLVLFHLYK